MTRLLLPLVVLTACGGTGPTGDDNVGGGTGGGEHHSRPPGSFSESTMQLGVDLYREIASRPGNVAISPASVATALTMTYGGARAETAAEMQRVLRLDPGTAHESAGAALREWNDPERDTYVLRVANRLFVQESYPLEESFLRLGQDRYGASAEALRFASEPDPSRLHINAWIAEQTEHRIENLLPPNSITPLTRVVLTNAVYFHGRWLHAFDPEATTDAPFHLDGGETVEVPTMSMTAALRYSEDEAATMLELPYVGEELAMLFVVPRAVDGLRALETNLDAEDLNARIGALAPTRVRVALPRFVVSPPAMPLKDALSALGMPRAFGDEADFSGLAAVSPGDLRIDEVFHQAFVEVNEEGTEAAAATAVVIRTRRAQPAPTPFVADRPFLFLLRDTRTGATLFMGRVADPRSG